MPQLGVLFDPNKLGAHLYQYTAFRIFFSAADPVWLGGATLLEGLLEPALPGRVRPYCIAVETRDRGALAAIRQAMRNGTLRGLLPEDGRFLEEQGVASQSLNLAAQFNAAGELAHSGLKFVEQAWQRNQAHAAALQAAPPAVAPTAPAASEPRQENTPSRQAQAASVARPAPPPAASLPAAPFPARAPFALRWPETVLRALFAILSAAGGAGAYFLLPAAREPLALSGGVVAGWALLTAWWRWLRLGALERLSRKQLALDAARLAAEGAFPHLSRQLNTPAAERTPLLDRLRILTRHWMARPSMEEACAVLREHADADESRVRGGYRLLEWQAGALAGLALTSGPNPALMGGALCVWFLASALKTSEERVYAEVRRRVADLFLPALAHVAPTSGAQAAPSSAPLETALEQQAAAVRSMTEAVKQLASLGDQMRRSQLEICHALEQFERSGLSGSLEGLKESLNRLGPVLEEFREPFVLQAVPAAPRFRPKSATVAAGD